MFIIGRVDDVNVSGHRFGTAEIENAGNASSVVTESAVVGYPHDIKVKHHAYVILEEGDHNAEEVRKAIVSTLVAEIGPIAKLMSFRLYRVCQRRVQVNHANF